MIVEKQIEDAILAKIRMLDLPGVRVVGAWSIVGEGEVKGESDESGAVVAVAVAPRSYDGFMSPQADVNCSIALSVRRDTCPTGSDIVELTEPLFQLLDHWNRDEDAVYTDLTTEGFSPGGLQLTGGDGPEYDSASGVWNITQTFTLRGIVN